MKWLAAFGLSVYARDIVFPPSLDIGRESSQVLLNNVADAFEGDQTYAGLTTYANLPWVPCLSKSNDERFDIAFLGAPFDTAVTARPGARFGPTGIRLGGRRIHANAAWSAYTHENAFLSWAKIVDCGDAPLTFLDNTAALKQLENAHKAVAGRKTNASDVASVPRIITFGGDHTTTLAALRSTYHHWGPVSVIHFDSHLDTWDPKVLGGGISHYAGVVCIPAIVIRCVSRFVWMITLALRSLYLCRRG